MYSGKVVVFGQSGCILESWLNSTELVIFGQNWLYSGKVVVFGQSGCIWAKVVVFGQDGCIWEKLVLVGHIAFRLSKWL